MNKNKKTIFMTIGTGVVARNLLNNSFYEDLKQNFNVVIISPLFDDQEFKRRFSGENISFEPLFKHKLSYFELFLISLHKGLIYNESVKIKSFYSLSSTMKQKRTLRKLLKNYTELAIFGLFLFRIPILRDWLKIIDRLVYKKDYYRGLYDKYNPSLVFITNMSSDDEIYLLRSGKRKNIQSIGMTKSWDNFSKIGFRDKVDTVIVWSNYMKDEVLEYQNYKEKNIKIVGIPQFDVLHEIKASHTHEDFIDVYNLDPQKKTILFGQSNPLLNPDDAYVCGVIKKWIKEKGNKYQLLIRPHFRHKNAEKPFLPLVDNKYVFIDLLNNPSNFSSGAWDLSMESQIRRALSLRYSDVVVNSTSTLVLDTVCSDNHFISYAFDKEKGLPYGDSVKRIFDLLWFVDLKKNGFSKMMVHDEEELTKRLEEILSKEDETLPKENERIIKRFCYKADGCSGKRLFSVINNLL